VSREERCRKPLREEQAEIKRRDEKMGRRMARGRAEGEAVAEPVTGWQCGEKRRKAGFRRTGRRQSAEERLQAQCAPLARPPQYAYAQTAFCAERADSIQDLNGAAQCSGIEGSVRQA